MSMTVTSKPMICGNCDCENEPGARYCSVCGWSPERGTPRTVEPARPKSYLRLIVGVFAVIALVWIFYETMHSYMSPAMASASAIQVMQVYVEGCFLAIMVIGLTISTYVASR